MLIGEPKFEQACQAAVGQLRAALIELFDSASIDPLSPQDVARDFGLNKTLTWNIARLLQAPDNITAIAHVPGAASLEKLVESLSGRGASAETVGRARTAVRAFETMIEDHVGDRSTLDLVVDSMVSQTTDSLDLSRKLAFRGNSGIYGVQAKTRFACYLVAPNRDDPSLLDIGLIAGYVGFRRLRSSIRWSIFKNRHWGDKRETPSKREAIDHSNGEAGGDVGGELKGLGLIKAFTRGNVSDIQVIESDVGTDFVLMPGNVGNAGAFDCAHGEIFRQSAPRYKTATDDIGELGAFVTTPTEHLVVDIIVHRDLGFILKPELLVFARIFSSGDRSASPDDLSALPIRQRVVELSGTPPAVATPLVPRYAEVVHAAYPRMGVDPSHMRAVRLEMRYPPLGSSVILRFPLADAPK